ncbi:MAG: hypothetical protein M0025_04280 [Elusimicrobia bacterium]|nr:hypothetical protein [Elusimicrobiota bacterium]
MKNTGFIALFAAFPAALCAQTPALSQLAPAAVRSAAAPEVPTPAAVRAGEDRSVLLLLDPRTGKTIAVIPAGGGFIYAATGKFQPAVYNGSGYVLPGGQFLPALGGSRAPKPDGLTGRWLGWGEWTYQGSGARCDMKLEFEDTPDYLLRKGGYFDCGFAALASEPARFAKKGSQLLDEAGNPAGSYEGGVVTLREAYGADVSITTTIKADGLHFDYSEIWTVKDGSELYVITGRLFTGG